MLLGWSLFSVSCLGLVHAKNEFAFSVPSVFSNTDKMASWGFAVHSQRQRACTHFLCCVPVTEPAFNLHLKLFFSTAVISNSVIHLPRMLLFSAG